MKKKVIDLFCGAGGFSHGFELAGFEVVAGVDFDANAIQSFRKNHPNSKGIYGDLTELTAKKILSEIKIKREDIEVVIGGPPCQGYSHAGKRSIDDPRNQLFKEFVKVVDYIRPKIIVVENVLGLATMNKGSFVKEIIDVFQEIGYEMEMRVLTSSHYGVPQHRRRTIFIGRNDGEDIVFPTPMNITTTVGDAISNLPYLSQNGELDVPFTQYIPVNKYQLYMQGYITVEDFYNNEFIFKDSSFGVEKKLIFNHWTSKSKPETVEKMKLIPMGENWSSLPEELRNKGKYSNLYKRLDLNEPSITLTNLRKSMILHPIQDRLLSIREGARLQSLPDSFVFIGPLSSQQQQVGNCVPSLLAYNIAKNL